MRGIIKTIIYKMDKINNQNITIEDILKRLNKRSYTTLIRTDRIAKEIFKENVKLIQQYDTKFSKCDQLVYDAILRRKRRAVLFVGPAGTGKTVLVRLMAAQMGAPLITWQATEGMPIQDFMTSLLVAYSKGYQILIDDINMAPANIIELIRVWCLWETPSIKICGKTYKRHPNFVLYTTWDPKYKGTENFDISFRSMFLVHEVGRLTETIFTSRMVNYSKHFYDNPLSIEFYKKLYKYGRHVAEFAGQWGENVEICIRNAQDLTSLILTKPCTREEFFESVADSYLNFLSIDSDNYEKIKYLKNTEDEIKIIDDLYSEYKMLIK